MPDQTLLHLEISIDDLKDVDAEIYRSLVERLQRITEEELVPLDLDFTYNDVFLGK